MNNSETTQIPFGIFELDARGVVVNFSPVSEAKLDGFPKSIVGRDFFRDLLSNTQVKELKRRFLTFMADGVSVERLSISFPYNQSSIKVQIVMAHLSEKSDEGRKRFALVRLMPDEPSDRSPLVTV